MPCSRHDRRIDRSALQMMCAKGRQSLPSARLAVTLSKTSGSLVSHLCYAGGGSVSTAIRAESNKQGFSATRTVIGVCD